eukprot:symbB.v1.2.028061.t1/scaffold2935.1/size102186/1
MERTWGTLATELKDQVQVASLDAQAFRPLTERWHVDRFPTMKLVKGDEVYDFDGDRTVEDLKAFALDTFRETLPSHKLPAGESHRRPAGERVQEAGPVPSSYWHLVIGFGLGMLCAAVAWAMCLWSPSSKTTPDDDDGVKEMKGKANLYGGRMELQGRFSGANCQHRRYAVEASKNSDASKGSSRRAGKKADTKGVSVLKSEDFAAWYTQVITRAEMIEYHDI